MTAYTFDQIIDFTRTSAATYVANTGFVTQTPASRNLLTYTQEFDNAAWTKSNASAYPFDPAAATYGAELCINGDFASATGWTASAGWAISGGQAIATATSTSLYGGQMTTVAGRAYRVDFDVVSYTSGNLSVTVGANYTGQVILTAPAPGRYTVYIASGSSTTRGVEFYGGSVTATIDNISVREVIGGLITAPDGTLTGDVLAEDATSGIHAVQQSTTLPATAHNFSVYLKAGVRTWAQVLNGTIANGFAYFDLANGAVGTVGAGVTSASITSVGNGWYRCSISFPALFGGNISAVRAATANGTSSYAGTAGASAIYLWGAQLEAVPDANLVLGAERVSSPTAIPINANSTVSVVGDTITCTCTTAGTLGFTFSPSLNAIVGQSSRVSTNILTNPAARQAYVDLGGFTTGLGAVTGVITRATQAAINTSQFGVYVAGALIGETFSVSLSSLSVRQITGTTGMPTAYTRNVGGLYPPRFDYDPVTLAPRGLLIEEQRTNLLTYSEQFDNAAWAKTRSSITANATTSPDGTVDADKLVEDTTAAASHFVSQNIASHTSGVSYTMTVYAKAAERSQIRVNGDAAIGLSIPAIFDLSSGTVVSAGSFTASIQNAGNGWYRCVCTGTATATSAGVWVVGIAVAGNTSYTGDGTSGLFLWGAQLEAGAFATSYIPTVASQVTRTADVAQVTGPNFARWYNSAEGTVVAEFSSFMPTTSSQALWTISDGTNDERWFAFCASSSIRHFMVDGGATQASIDVGTYSANAVLKSAMAIRANSVQASVNGALGVEDTSATIPTVNKLGLGTAPSAATGFLNGHIRRIRYYPTRLSNAQLQALTA